MITATTLYNSSNGDRWQLLHDDETGLSYVPHEPNLCSGGKVIDTPVPQFVSRSGSSPQAVALKELLNKRDAIDPDLDAWK